VKGQEWADWYVLHEPLMMTKVPKWIDARNLTEREHFLRLPAELQKKYIQMFWEMRSPGLADEFYERVAYAQSAFGHFENPWRSPMGRVFLLLGAPMSINYYRHGVLTMGDSMPEPGDYQVWMYISWGAGTAYYVFIYLGADWKVDMTGIRQMGDQRHVEENAKMMFAPNAEGWDLWADTLYAYLQSH